MRLSLLAAGRARSGPENELTARYVDRINRAGPAVGLGPTALTEYDTRQGAERLVRNAVSRAGAKLCALDERGSLMNSGEFARILSKWRDNGCREAVFLIGGADGIDADLARSADCSISLGRMTFPHLIARALMAEQLYRSVSILSGTPYHRA